MGLACGTYHGFAATESRRVIFAQKPKQLLDEPRTDDVVAAQRAADVTIDQSRLSQGSHVLGKMCLHNGNQRIEVPDTLRPLAKCAEDYQSHGMCHYPQ